MYCPQCGTQNSDRNRFCSNCGGSIAGQAPTVVGMPQTPAAVPVPAQAGPYSPTGAAAPGSLRRVGSVLIANHGAQFPPYCVKCGQPAQKWVNKNFSWHNPLLYILLISPVIYIIVALIVSKRMRLQVPLCSSHYTTRRTWLTLGWIMLAGFIPVPIMISALGNGSDDVVGVAVLIGFAMFIGSLVCLVVGNALLRTSEITDTEATFRGLSSAFLQYVPEQPVAAAAAAAGIGSAQMR